MGWHNPIIPWSDFERALSDERRPKRMPKNADGGDSPAWSLKRGPYQPPAGIERDADALPYAELHAHSSFSFLDGASSPEQLVEEAERLGLHALAITDHDGFYGIVRFAEAAEKSHVKTVFGAELSLGLSRPQNGEPDPEGSHLLVLARGAAGYHRLAAALTEGQLRGKEKGRPVYDLRSLADAADGHWAILTGCRKGAVRQALTRHGPTAAGDAIDELTHLFGRQNVYVELIDHGLPLDDEHNDALATLAADRGLPVVASGNVHYAAPKNHHLAQAMAAVRARRSLDEADGWLPAAGTAHLRSGREMRDRFARYPGAVERTVALADELAFELRKVKPVLPKQEVPPGHTPMSWLRHLVWEAVPEKYPDLSDADRDRIENELAVIEKKDFPGYFLIVHDIVAFARSRGILCQRLGRQLGGLLPAEHHGGRRDLLQAPVRAVPVEPARRGARHRRRLRCREARGGHPVGVRPLRARERGAGGQRHPVPAQERHPRHGEGARPFHRAAGCVEQAGGGGRAGA